MWSRHSRRMDANHPFAIRVLPGRPWCDWNFLNTHVLDALLEVVAVDAVAIANEKTWCFLVRESVDDLLGGPFGVGIGGHVEMHDLPPIVTEHDEDVQDTEGHGRNREEVARGDVGNMIVEKCPPGLRRRFPSADHVLGHGLFGDVVAQQGQFGYDSRCAPGRVLTGHAANQVTDFPFGGRAAGLPGPRLPSPIQLKTPSVPLDDRFGLHDRQGGSPVPPEPR